MLSHVVGRFPTEEGRQGNSDGVGPGEDNQNYGPSDRAKLCVMEGLRYGVISVVTNDAQVDYTSRAADNVHGDPEITEDGPKVPHTLQLVNQSEGRDEDPDQDIADGQTDDEDVADAMKTTVDEYGENHQAVAKHGADDNENSENGDEDVDGSSNQILANAIHGKVRKPPSS